jgi:DNA-binding NtrC family response regulator
MMSNFVTLLVEDDHLQREIMAELLKEEGLEVIECDTAEAAELIVAATGADLRALITDNNLAGTMSGTQLAQYARSQHPQMNIVIISGKTLDTLPKDATFLLKPFDPTALLQVIRDCG